MNAIDVSEEERERFEEEEDEEEEEEQENIERIQVKGDDDEIEKKRTRLARNKLSARESRLRKKTYMLELLKQIAQYETENMGLRLRLKNGQETQTQDMEENTQLTTKLEMMVKEGHCEKDIREAILEMQEKYSDYGKDRQSNIQFHMSQLRSCLRPTQTTRTMIWFMQIAPLFLNPDGNIDVFTVIYRKYHHHCATTLRLNQGNT